MNINKLYVFTILLHSKDQNKVLQSILSTTQYSLISYFCWYFSIQLFIRFLSTTDPNLFLDLSCKTFLDLLSTTDLSFFLIFFSTTFLELFTLQLYVIIFQYYMSAPELFFESHDGTRTNGVGNRQEQVWLLIIWNFSFFEFLGIQAYRVDMGFPLWKFPRGYFLGTLFFTGCFQQKFANTKRTLSASLNLDCIKKF